MGILQNGHLNSLREHSGHTVCPHDLNIIVGRFTLQIRQMIRRPGSGSGPILSWLLYSRSSLARSSSSRSLQVNSNDSRVRLTKTQQCSAICSWSTLGPSPIIRSISQIMSAISHRMCLTDSAATWELTGVCCLAPCKAKGFYDKQQQHIKLNQSLVNQCYRNVVVCSIVYLIKLVHKVFTERCTPYVF